MDTCLDRRVDASMDASSQPHGLPAGDTSTRPPIGTCFAALPHASWRTSTGASMKDLSKAAARASPPSRRSSSAMAPHREVTSTVKHLSTALLSSQATNPSAAESTAAEAANAPTLCASSAESVGISAAKAPARARARCGAPPGSDSTKGRYPEDCISRLGSWSRTPTLACSTRSAQLNWSKCSGRISCGTAAQRAVATVPHPPWWIATALWPNSCCRFTMPSMV
eukprot:scaffold11792_cov112-Isochrysis_galbana.AAC.4